MKSIKTQIMVNFGEFIDEVLGEKYTGWNTFISWDGQIVDMDEVGVVLLQRLQTTEHKDGFLHKVRAEIDI